MKDFLDRDDDGHLGIGDRSFANLMYEEEMRTMYDSEPGDNEPGTCGYMFLGCVIPLGAVAIFLGVAYWWASSSSRDGDSGGGGCSCGCCSWIIAIPVLIYTFIVIWDYLNM